jgi:hypothetical protein
VLIGEVAMLAGCAGLLWTGQTSGYGDVLVQELVLGGAWACLSRR